MSAPTSAEPPACGHNVALYAPPPVRPPGSSSQRARFNSTAANAAPWRIILAALRAIDRSPRPRPRRALANACRRCHVARKAVGCSAGARRPPSSLASLVHRGASPRRPDRAVAPPVPVGIAPLAARAGLARLWRAAPPSRPRAPRQVSGRRAPPSSCRARRAAQRPSCVSAAARLPPIVRRPARVAGTRATHPCASAAGLRHLRAIALRRCGGRSPVARSIAAPAPTKKQRAPSTRVFDCRQIRPRASVFVIIINKCSKTP